MQYIFGDEGLDSTDIDIDVDSSRVSNVINTFELDSDAESRLLEFADDRKRFYERQGKSPSYIYSWGPLEVRVGINDAGQADARIGWEYIRKSDGMGATHISFKGVTLDSPSVALAYIERTLDEIAEKAEAGKEGFASAEDVKAMRAVFDAEAAEAKDHFLLEFRRNTPELAGVPDETLREMVDAAAQRPRRDMHRDRNDLERYIIVCMLESDATISYCWDREANEIHSDYIRAWAPRSYIRVEGTQRAIVEDYNADPYSYAGGGKKIAEHELNLKPEQLADIRRAIFEAETKK